MGNKGKNNARKAKRNKISKASKKAWIARNQKKICSDISGSSNVQQNANTEKVQLFEDIEDFNAEYDNKDSSAENVVQIENRPEIVEIEAETEFNVRSENWCTKVYPPAVNVKSSVSFQSSGIISTPDYQKIMETPFTIVNESDNRPPVISGNRIVELGYVIDWAINLQYDHSKVCTCGKIYVHKEIRRNKGLNSTIIFKCTQCDVTLKQETENPRKGEINRGAVWGTMATGSTFGHLEELLSCMNIPCMQDSMFYDLEKEVGAVWRNSLWSSMQAAGVRERINALEKGQVCADGVPWITVYVDGSWSKRSYGTNYNALSGMVGIIGRYTKEVLFVAVRNKFCSICAKAESKNYPPKEHLCHKNWDNSASSMEADMAVEGFSRSEEMHHIRYLQFIADGDSSVFAKIKQRVPYGNDVRKIECTNHAIKNYGKHLRKVKVDKTIDIMGRKLLTLKKIEALTKRAKCSIYEHAKKDTPDAQLLQKDLKLSMHHVFGDHSGCREDICNDIGNDTNNQIPALKSTFIYNHLQGALNLLVKKSHLLITNENNNAAERLMNIVSRFTTGKRLNLIQRGSYERRIHLAGLRYNRAFKWHHSPWKNYTGNSPGDHFSSYMERQTSKKINSRKRLFEDDEEKTQRKKKQKTMLQKNIDYGACADEPETVEDLEFILNESKLVIDKLQVTNERINLIQRDSRGQFGNKVFEAERELRLTASLFGRVIHRRPYTPCHSLVKSCLKPTPFSTEATEYGIAKEDVAIQKFEEQHNLQVERSGIWIDEEHGFLAASPDGLIGHDAIIEVKCIYAPDKTFVKSIEELIPLLKNPFMTKINDGIMLKRQHNYYFQIQGQLNITKRDKCYFVVYVNDKVPIHVEIIRRDEDVWVSKMLPKLCHFYENCIAPEIVRGNLQKNKRCVDPACITAAIEEHLHKQRTKDKKRDNLGILLQSIE